MKKVLTGTPPLKGHFRNTANLPCNKNRVFPGNFFSQGKHVFITGDPVLIERIPVMKTGFSL